MVELSNKSMALVLNDGIPGKKFVDRYTGETVPYFDNALSKAYMCRPGNHWIWQSRSAKIEEVYYYVLAGDVKGWVEEARILHAIKGHGYNAPI